MALPPGFLDELRARTPLAAVIGRRMRLAKSGRQWKGCCPFHGEKTPSFYVYDDHFHCFGCGVHGDAISFVMQSQGASFPEAVEQLAAEAGPMAWPVTKGTPDVGPAISGGPAVAVPAGGPSLRVPLMRIAHARSGDKGDTANIGLIGRSPECYGWLREHISAALVKEWFAGTCLGHVERHEVPNLWALNFLLEETLGGGGTMSLFIDAQGKTLSQALLRCVVEIPQSLLATISAENAPCVGELVPGGEA